MCENNFASISIYDCMTYTTFMNEQNIYIYKFILFLLQTRNAEARKKAHFIMRQYPLSGSRITNNILRGTNASLKIITIQVVLSSFPATKKSSLLSF